MDWLKQKTTWAAAGAIVAAIGAGFTGDLRWAEVALAVLIAASQIFQRQATAKVQASVEAKK